MRSRKEIVRRRMRKVVWVGPIILIIMFMLKGLVVPITAVVTGLTLAGISGLLFDKRDDDTTKDIEI